MTRTAVSKPGGCNIGRRRIARVAASDVAMQERLARLIDVAARGLPRMRARDGHSFAFTRKRVADGQLALIGDSLRYAAVVSLGAAKLDESTQQMILDGQTAVAFCGRLIDELSVATNLGDAALVVWAAAELGHPKTDQAIGCLVELLNHDADGYTVEVAWTLSALATADRGTKYRAEARAAWSRLRDAFCPDSGLFCHWTKGRVAPWYRRHVSCFADQVYPIQALARYHRAFGCESSLDTAAACAARICRLQGPAGQWWWHYDVRTGQVVEGYPVYTVHQDSMAPMALMDLHEAGGPDFTEAIRRGLRWMTETPEVNRCLIDDEQVLIWRSVKRSDPGKAVRKIRAVVSRMAPMCRLKWMDKLFRPTVVDYEDRPYHLGWILYAWLGHL